MRPVGSHEMWKTSQKVPEVSTEIDDAWSLKEGGVSKKNKKIERTVYYLTGSFSSSSRQVP